MAKHHSREMGLVRYSPVFYQCRAFHGHQWKITALRKTTIDIEVNYVCNVCTSHKFEHRDSGGHLIRRTYSYPDGYLFEKGVRPHSSYFFMRLIDIMSDDQSSR